MVVASDGRRSRCSAGCSHARQRGRRLVRPRWDRYDGAPDTPTGRGLRIGYTGSQTVHIETSFKGEVYAPNAELKLTGEHVGRFFAKRVRVEAGAVLSLPKYEQSLASECAPKVPEGAPPEVRSLGPVPALTTAEDLPAFLHWFYRIRRGELGLAAAIIDQVSSDAEIAEAVITELNAKRSEADLGASLMLVEMLGLMRATTARTFLEGLIDEPLPPRELSGDGKPIRNAYTTEVAVRRQALFVLVSQPDGPSTDFVRAIATSHPDGVIRASAIRVLKVSLAATEREVLRDELQPDDQVHLDLPETSDPDFNDKLEAYLAQYGTN